MQVPDTMLLTREKCLELSRLGPRMAQADLPAWTVLAAFLVDVRHQVLPSPPAMQPARRREHHIAYMCVTVPEDVGCVPQVQQGQDVPFGPYVRALPEASRCVLEWSASEVSRHGTVGQPTRPAAATARLLHTRLLRQVVV